MNILDWMLIRPWPLTRRTPFLDRILAWRITSSRRLTFTPCHLKLAQLSLPEAERELSKMYRTLRVLESIREEPLIASSRAHRQRLSDVMEMHADVLNMHHGHSYHLRKPTPVITAPVTTSPVITAPPGWRLKALAELVFSPKTFREVFVPICHDLFEEHCEALKEGKIWKARAALVRNYYGFWSAFVTQAPTSVIKVIYNAWKAP